MSEAYMQSVQVHGETVADLILALEQLDPDTKLDVDRVSSKVTDGGKRILVLKHEPSLLR